MNDLPSKQEILDWISENPTQIAKRDIARAFGIKGAARIDLKRMLKELEAEGHLEKRKKTYRDPDKPPPVSVLRVTGLTPDGDLMAAPQIAREVTQALPATFYSRHWMQSHGNLFEAIQLSKKLVSFLVFIIIGVAAFNVVTAMIMVVRDKQGDIAILQTMGLGQRQIMQLFVCQGLVIGLIGTSLGAVIGLALAGNVTVIVQLLERVLDYQFLKSDVYPVTYLPSDIRPSDVLLVCGAALGLSLLATLYPAWRATRLLPAEVLRYDK